MTTTAKCSASKISDNCSALRAVSERVAFRVTVTFDTQSNGKTVLTLRQLHPTVEQRNAAIGFGAVEIGFTTLDKLAKHLGLGPRFRGGDE